MTYRAVLFDLDGTLLDTLEDLADSMNAVLARLGFPPRDAAEYKYIVGDGVLTMALRALPEGHRDEPTVARCVEFMRQEYGQRWAVKTRPYAGVAELLAELAARGIPLGVLSNKPDDFTKLCVGKLLPQGRFGAVLGVSPSRPKKPDPAGALEVAGCLGVPPDEFVYLGDTNTDMQTAVAAGMLPVGALWGFRAAEELLASGARILLAKPGDLLAGCEEAAERNR